MDDHHCQGNLSLSAGSGKLSVISIPKALAMSVLGDYDFGMEAFDAVTGIFRGYLAISARYGFYTIQVTVHSKVNGTDWGLTGIGFQPWQEVAYPKAMEIGVIGDGANAGVGSTSIVTGGGILPSSSNGRYVENEIVSGSGTSWTLSRLPVGTVDLRGSGQYLTPGVGNDYTISGTTITTVNSYSAGQLVAFYYTSNT